MGVLARNNVNIAGGGERTIVLAHGFGCDQTMWRWVAPQLARDHRVVLFDYVGAGRSDRAAYDSERYGSLSGYASDALDVLDALDLRDVIFVGHSISSMIGILASLERPELFRSLVLVAPSPRFVNDPPDYVGGFEPADVDSLLDLMDHNFMGWAQSLAGAASPVPELATELVGSFCSTDPRTARQFADITFRCDLRSKLPLVRTPSLILQCTHDDIAPISVGEYMRAHIPGSDYRLVDARGHCPHMSHPDVVVRHIREHLGQPAAGEA